jgi:hypothetical protein
MKVASMDIPYSAMEKVYKNLAEADRAGKYLVSYLGSERSRTLLGYLTKKGGHSEGIEHIIVTDRNPENIPKGAIAATFPKISPGVVFYNWKGAREYLKNLRQEFRDLDADFLLEDLLKHEIVHSYIHDQSPGNERKNEMEVEKALIFENSLRARMTKSRRNAKQYLMLANEHINRYLTHRHAEAMESGAKFDPEAEMQGLYDEYQSELADALQGNEAAGEEITAGKSAAMSAVSIAGQGSECDSESENAGAAGLEAIASEAGEGGE